MALPEGEGCAFTLTVGGVWLAQIPPNPTKNGKGSLILRERKRERHPDGQITAAWSDYGTKTGHRLGRDGAGATHDREIRTWGSGCKPVCRLEPSARSRAEWLGICQCTFPQDQTSAPYTEPKVKRKDGLAHARYVAISRAKPSAEGHYQRHRDRQFQRTLRGLNLSRRIVDTCSDFVWQSFSSCLGNHVRNMPQVSDIRLDHVWWKRPTMSVRIAPPQ